MVAQGRLKLLLVLRLHLGERHAQRTGCIAELAHRDLDRDRVDLAEERVDEVRIGNLHLAGFLGLAVEVELAHVVRLLRRDVREDLSLIHI